MLEQSSRIVSTRPTDGHIRAHFDGRRDGDRYLAPRIQHLESRIAFLAALLFLLPVAAHAATITLNTGETYTYCGGCCADFQNIDVQSGTATIAYCGACTKSVVNAATVTFSGDVIFDIASGRLAIQGPTDLDGGTRTITAYGCGFGASVRFNSPISNGCLILESISTDQHIYIVSANTHGNTTITNGDIKYQDNSSFGTGTITINGVTTMITEGGTTIANNMVVNGTVDFDWHAVFGVTSFTGNITIASTGTFENGQYVGTSAADFDMNGGTLNTNEEDMSIDTLTLTESSTINLGTDNTKSLTIGDSSGTTWTGGTTLTINNWTGTAVTGPSTGYSISITAGFFTQAQLDEIQFTGFAKGAAIVGGELVPDPPRP